MPERAFAPLVNISPSRLDAFAKCPLAFRYTYMMKMRGQPTVAQVQGSIVHRALEHLYNQPVGERTPEAATRFAAMAWDEFEATSEEFAQLSPEDLPKMRVAVDRLTLFVFDLENPDDIHPVGLEVWVRAEINEGVELRGIIDRLDFTDDGLEVWDWKTGRSPSDNYAANALRPAALYAWALGEITGVTPASVALAYLGDRRILRQTITAATIRGAVARARGVLDAIERASTTDNFAPSPSRLCDWCAFQAHCPAKGGTLLPACGEQGDNLLKPLQGVE